MAGFRYRFVFPLALLVAVAMGNSFATFNAKTRDEWRRQGVIQNDAEEKDKALDSVTKRAVTSQKYVQGGFDKKLPGGRPSRLDKARDRALASADVPNTPAATDASARRSSDRVRLSGIFSPTSSVVPPPSSAARTDACSSGEMLSTMMGEQSNERAAGVGAVSPDDMAPAAFMRVSDYTSILDRPMHRLLPHEIHALGKDSVVTMVVSQHSYRFNFILQKLGQSIMDDFKIRREGEHVYEFPAIVDKSKHRANVDELNAQSMTLSEITKRYHEGDGMNLRIVTHDSFSIPVRMKDLCNNSTGRAKIELYQETDNDFEYPDFFSLATQTRNPAKFGPFYERFDVSLEGDVEEGSCASWRHISILAQEPRDGLCHSDYR